MGPAINAHIHAHNARTQGGAFADFLQLSLAAFGLIGLLVKRAKETPPRPWKIWGMDVGKQCIGSLYAHFVNMLLAMGLSTLAGGGLDECAWYFINYLTDSSLGIILCLVFMKLLECWAGMQPSGSWARVYISQSGNYGKPPQCKIWCAAQKSRAGRAGEGATSPVLIDDSLLFTHAPQQPTNRYWQTLIWIGVVTVSKLGLFFFLLACSDRFGSWGHILFSPLYVLPSRVLFSFKTCALHSFASALRVISPLSFINAARSTHKSSCSSSWCWLQAASMSCSFGCLTTSSRAAARPTRRPPRSRRARR